MNLNDECFLTELNSIALMKVYNEIIRLPVVHEEEQPLIQYFEENHAGNDFVVGDIHCQFDKLEKHLDEIKFNKEIDRLFCMGDLIDRGKNGYRAIDYLAQDWFHSVMGNHEDMILSLLALPKDMTNRCHHMALSNGAEWLIENDKFLAELLSDYAMEETKGRSHDLTFEDLMANYPKLKQLYFEFSKLPYIIQIGKNIGIIHGEVPLFVNNWEELKENIEEFKAMLVGRSYPVIEKEGEIAFYADYKEFCYYLPNLS